MSILTTGTSTLSVDSAGDLAIIVAALLIYSIPSIIAISRGVHIARVLLINLFLGWTIIGWVSALILACASKNVYIDPPGVNHYYHAPAPVNHGVPPGWYKTRYGPSYWDGTQWAEESRYSSTNQRMGVNRPGLGGDDPGGVPRTKMVTGDFRSLDWSKEQENDVVPPNRAPSENNSSGDSRPRSVLHQTPPENSGTKVSPFRALLDGASLTFSFGQSEMPIVPKRSLDDKLKHVYSRIDAGLMEVDQK